jgi:hypothetical protein
MQKKVVMFVCKGSVQRIIALDSKGGKDDDD